jgi:hypothetical protein
VHSFTHAPRSVSTQEEGMQPPPPMGTLPRTGASRAFIQRFFRRVRRGRGTCRKEGGAPRPENMCHDCTQLPQANERKAVRDCVVHCVFMCMQLLRPTHSCYLTSSFQAFLAPSALMEPSRVRILNRFYTRRRRVDTHNVVRRLTYVKGEGGRMPAGRYEILVGIYGNITLQAFAFLRRSQEEAKS